MEAWIRQTAATIVVSGVCCALAGFVLLWLMVGMLVLGSGHLVGFFQELSGALPKQPVLRH